MDEMTHHRLAMRGSHAVERELAHEHEVMLEQERAQRAWWVRSKQEEKRRVARGIRAGTRERALREDECLRAQEQERQDAERAAVEQEREQERRLVLAKSLRATASAAEARTQAALRALGQIEETRAREQERQDAERAEADRRQALERSLKAARHLRAVRVAAERQQAAIASRLSLAPAPPAPAGPNKFQAAWVQWRGFSPIVVDVVSADYGQHIDALPNEVLLVPYEVADLLLALPNTQWVPQTVYPDVISFTQGSTGLDQIYVATVPCWGIHRTTGGPYFDPDNGPAAGEAARLLVEDGVPYLWQ